MVKGTVFSKSGGKTGTPGGRKPSGKKSQTKKTAISSDTDLPACIGCDTLITDDIRALCCDRCMNNEVWKCVDCLDMSPDTYDALTTSSAACLKWFCDDCDKDKDKDKAVVRAKDEKEVDKTGDILKLLEQLVEGSKAVEHRLDSIERSLEDKADMRYVQNVEDQLKLVESKVGAAVNVAPLEPRLQKLETNAGVIDAMENRLQQLEGSSKSLSETVHNVQQASVLTDMKFKDCIEKVVEARYVEDQAEKEEREKRKTSVIVHGVAESEGMEATEREEDDMGALASIMYEINCDDIKLNQVIRLGRHSQPTANNEQAKPRPILVQKRKK